MACGDGINGLFLPMIMFDTKHTTLSKGKKRKSWNDDCKSGRPVGRSLLYRKTKSACIRLNRFEQQLLERYESRRKNTCPLKLVVPLEFLFNHGEHSHLYAVEVSNVVFLSYFVKIDLSEPKTRQVR
jgi:hypothetical protein